jgi:hypothetical protein
MLTTFILAGGIMQKGIVVLLLIINVSNIKPLPESNYGHSVNSESLRSDMVGGYLIFLFGCMLIGEAFINS